MLPNKHLPVIFDQRDDSYRHAERPAYKSDLGIERPAGTVVEQSRCAQGAKARGLKLLCVHGALHNSHARSPMPLYCSADAAEKRI